MSLLPESTLWRRLSIAGVVVLGLLLAWVAWATLAANTFAGRIAAIRAAGDPASISDLQPKPIPFEDDAAAELAEVSAQIVAFAKEHGRYYNTPLGKAYNEARETGEPASTEQIAAIKVILDRYPQLDAAITKAAACEKYASRLDYSASHQQLMADLGERVLSDNRTASRFVEWQIEVALAEGRQADAIRKSIDLLRLGQLMRAEPGLVGGMIGYAVCGTAAGSAYDALSAGPVPDELHAALDRELSLHDDLRPFVWTVKSERALAISALQQQFGGVQGLFMNTVGRPMKLHHTATLDLFAAVLKDADRPWHETAAKTPPSGIFKTPTGMGVFADLMQPSLQAAYKSANRHLAIARALRIFNEIRRAEQKGEEPKSLEDVSLPKEAKTDPFSGKPLHLRHVQQGWLVYSVGENGTDEGGGDFHGDKDVGVGRSQDE